MVRGRDGKAGGSESDKVGRWNKAKWKGIISQKMRKCNKMTPKNTKGRNKNKITKERIRKKEQDTETRQGIQKSGNIILQFQQITNAQENAKRRKYEGKEQAIN